MQGDRMKYGYSILLQELVEAERLDYGDCADFQVVCPVCMEATFKKTREQSGHVTHFISHYKASANNQACELRVSSWTKDQVDSFNSVSRGQNLEKFLAVLPDLLLSDWVPPEQIASFKNRMAQQLKIPSINSFARGIVASTHNFFNLWEKQITEGKQQSLVKWKMHGMVRDTIRFVSKQQDLKIAAWMGTFAINLIYEMYLVPDTEFRKDRKDEMGEIGDYDQLIQIKNEMQAIIRGKPLTAERAIIKIKKRIEEVYIYLFPYFLIKMLTVSLQMHEKKSLKVKPTKPIL